MKINVPIATEAEIESAYQLILGRYADQPGLDYFRTLAIAQSLTSHDIARFLVDSDEFRRGGSAQHEPVEIALGGYSIFVRSSDRDIGGAIAKGIQYEPHISALLRRELSQGETFLDVGANVGYFTMMAAQQVGPAGKVVAVEPMDKNLQLIYLGIDKNGFDNVDVYPFGASDRSALVRIVTDPNTSNALVQSSASQRHSTLHAPTRTLDWMCADLSRLDLVKMDIEGHEMFAWQGARNLFERFKPKIITEFHPMAMRENAGIDCRDYLNMLLGYSKLIQVVVTPELLIACSSSDEVMGQWQRNDDLSGGNGSTHLDLYLSPNS